VAIATDDPLLLAGTILLAREARGGLVLVRGGAPFEKVLLPCAACGVTVLVGGTLARPRIEPLPGAGNRPPGGGFLGIFTSGTSGEPKLALHDWDRIEAPASRVPRRLRGGRWLMAFEPTSFAGLQVFLAATASGGELLFPEGGLERIPRLMVRRKVDVVSATPTWWRLLSGGWPPGLARPRLRQATLGGEIVGQDLLDLVRREFRPARITHIYASTEAGSAIVVSDGLAGFPAAWLSGAGPRLRLREGRLEIRSGAGMIGYAGAPRSSRPRAWYTTPDLAVIRGDRVVILGREDGVLVVGGAKVSPEEVEALVESIDGVAGCLVHGRRNPITGMLLAAEVAPRPGTTLDPVAIRSWLEGQLPPHKVPRIWRIVDRIPVSENGKKIRR
jgi:acyl-coenzyme A synthetase/AMP-(fatty) acid ligase